jgi:hypothetical protein
VEISQSKGIYGFGNPGRLYGVLVVIRGQAYLFGASRRGFFWRFGAKIFSPVSGYFDSVFGLRTGIGKIELLLKAGLKDEMVTVRFRRNWIHGNLFVSRHGLYTFNLRAIDPEIFPQIPSKTPEDFAELSVEDASFYLSDYKERY